MTDLFFYGTLCHLPLLEKVLGRAPGKVEKARLPGFGVYEIIGQNHPVLRERAGAVAQGIVLSGLSPAEVARFDYYELGFEYRLGECRIETAQGGRPAQVYFPQTKAFQTGDLWSLAGWVDRWGALVVATADEFMDGFGHVSEQVAASHYPQMMVRAASRLLAAVQNPTVDTRQGLRREQVQTVARRQPYTNFFSLVEHDLKFPQFENGMSQTVTRAALVGGDAVTVLPYDPGRDRVMVIEQYRFGADLRGDRFPWTLEPIAGRIDPGETAEQAVHREMAEEAGLSCERLLHVADYYPSPGAYTEYLHTYVAIADLPDEAAGIAGLQGEGEDIKSHVLPFSQAMELISSGEAETGPLILTLLWLQGQRAAIRRDA